ncbi:MAG: hypothetical protein Kow00120_02000 [Anaerolineae bacterium]
MNPKDNHWVQTLKKPEILMSVISVVAAILITLINILPSVEDEIASQWTWVAVAILLGLLAGTQIVTSYKTIERDEQLETMMSLLEKARISGATSLQLRSELQPLLSRAPNAKDVLIIGRSLVFVMRYTEYLQERLRDGASIRLVMVNVNNEAVMQAIGPFLETSVEGLVADVRSSIELAKHIMKEVPSPGKLQVRLVDYVPTLSLSIIDGQIPTGHIVVELEPYRVSTPRKPDLILKADESPFWFTYFRDLAEHIWRDAIPIESIQQ